MTDRSGRVFAGVDAHTDAHYAAVLDGHGRLLGTAEFPATTGGYTALADWVGRHGEIERIGVESTGSFAAALVRVLIARAITVVEVNQPHTYARHRRGKSDPLDAELAARAVLSGAASAIPKHTGGVVEAIRQLSLARNGAIKARSAALNQLQDLVVTAPDELRAALNTRRRFARKRRSASNSAPTAAGYRSRCKPASSHCAASHAASESSTTRSANSTDSSSRSSTRPPHAQPVCSESAPTTPASCSSPPAKTSTDSKTKQPSRGSAPPHRSPPAPGAATATGSTRAATAKPTAPST
jgi:hypothetical protein